MKGLATGRLIQSATQQLLPGILAQTELSDDGNFPKFRSTHPAISKTFRSSKNELILSELSVRLRYDERAKKQAGVFDLLLCDR